MCERDVGRNRAGAPRLHQDPERVARVRPRLAGERAHGRGGRPDRRLVPRPGGRRPHAGGRRTRRSHSGDPDGDPRGRGGLERRHRAAVRAPRQAARDGGVARGPRSVDAGARGRSAVRAGRRRRRLRRLRQPHRDPGGARGRRLARPVRRAHRVERGVGFARPAVLHRGPGRPHRHAEPRDLPRFGVHRLRAALGHHVVAGARVGHAAGRHRHRRPALRRRVGHGALDVPDRPHAARPRGGRPDRRDPRPGTHRRDPGEPGARGSRHGRRDRAHRRPLPLRRGRRTDVRRSGRAAAVAYVARDAQRGRRRRAARHRPRRQRVAAEHVAQAVVPHPAHVRSGGRTRRRQGRARGRSAVRRPRVVQRR